MVPTKRKARALRRGETPAETRARVRKIIARLERAYPDAVCALHHTNPLELLVATILSRTKEKTPEKIERDLMALVPRDKWTWFSHTLILHGRRICIARRPKCEECVVNRWCPSSRV